MIEIRADSIAAKSYLRAKTALVQSCRGWHRIFVPYPPDVIEAVDKIVSHGRRTAFLVDLAKREIKRQRLLQILQHPEPIWNPEDHPEIDAGNWLRQMRMESEARFQRLQSQPESE